MSRTRTPRRFRPFAGETLEDRAVPSTLTALVGGVSARAVASLPARDAQAVARQFATFQQTFLKDVQTILVPPGTTNPANNRPGLDQAIATALTTLYGSIDATIKDLPSYASLTATIRGELLGPASNSLQGLLATIPTPVNSSGAAVGAFRSIATIYIKQSQTTVTVQVRTSQSPASRISPQVVRQDLNQARAAFNGFSRSYASNIQRVLLPPGTTNPATHRAAFNQAVAAALSTLNAGVAAAQSGLPPALGAALRPTLQADLLDGSGASNTLQSRLAGLQSPTDLFGPTARAFRVASSQIIGSFQSQVNRDITIAVNQYNASSAAG
jgi:hypothetical protein